MKDKFPSLKRPSCPKISKQRNILTKKGEKKYQKKQFDYL